MGLETSESFPLEFDGIQAIFFTQLIVYNENNL